MNRVKYLDGKYMTWEETMEDFHENLKIKKAEEAYKEYLSNLQNGFPDKQKLPKAPAVPQDPISMPLNTIQNPSQFNTNDYQLEPQFNITYNQQANFNQPQPSFQTSFNQSSFNTPPTFNQQTDFNASTSNFNLPNFNQFNQGFDFNQFSNQFSNQFNSNGFNSSGFNSNGFNSFSQFGRNNSFSTNASFTPKSSLGQLSFNSGVTRLPVQFKRLENDIIFEEPTNNFNNTNLTNLNSNLNTNLNLNNNLGYF